MRIAVVGTGYVGLVTGACLAEVGHHVVCVDTDLAKVKKMQAGVSPIFEPGLDAMLKRNSEHGRLAFTTDLAQALDGAHCAFIAVGTPEKEDGSADLKYVTVVARDLGRLATNDMLVVVKSTVPVGTCDVVEKTIEGELRARNSKLALPVASNPEFLKEGTAIEDFMKPDRVICGVESDGAVDVLKEMYEPFVVDDPGKIFFMDRHSSELTKYGANAMLAVRISFMNELSRLCEKVGANIDQVRRGIGADPRIGRKFLYAGPGYGGSCFPKDVAALIKSGAEHGAEMAVLEGASRANLAQKRHAASKIVAHFGSVKGKRIALWGLAFKPGTDDVRESPARTIAEVLIKGGATVVGHDPVAMESFRRDIGAWPGFEFAKSAEDALRGADALALVTEWAEYKRPNWETLGGLMRTLSVFDFRNQYDRSQLEAAGFHYECIGRPKSRPHT